LRHWRIPYIPVDPDHSRFDFFGDHMSSGDVPGEDGSTKAIGGVIGTFDGFRLRLELVDANEGPENLFLVDRVVILGISSVLQVYDFAGNTLP